MIYFFVSLVTYFCYQILKERKILISLNELDYDLKKFKGLVFSKKSFLTFELLGLIIVLMAFFFNSKVVGISMIVLYMLLSLLEIKNMSGKYKHDSKINRTILFVVLIYFVLFGLIVLNFCGYKNGYMVNDYTNFYYLIVIVFGYLLYVFTYICALAASKINKKIRQ